MNNKLFSIQEWAWKIEFTFRYIYLEAAFGKHLYLENNHICACRLSKSDYKKMLRLICKTIPINILRTIIFATRLTSEIYCAGELRKVGKQYCMIGMDLFVEEYFELIKSKNRNDLSVELIEASISHQQYDMINLGSIIDLETIYDDFDQNRCPIWAFPGGLTIKAKNKYGYPNPL